MDEEIAIEVHAQAPVHTQSSLGEMLNTLVLAGIGAVALTRDETEAFVGRLKEQGTLAQKDSEKLLTEVAQRLRPSGSLEPGNQPLQQGLAQFLNRLNIPSKQDIDDLSSRVAQLSARLEELQRRPDDQRQESPTS